VFFCLFLFTLKPLLILRCIKPSSCRVCCQDAFVAVDSPLRQKENDPRGVDLTKINTSIPLLLHRKSLRKCSYRGSNVAQQIHIPPLVPPHNFLKLSSLVIWRIVNATWRWLPITISRWRALTRLAWVGPIPSTIVIRTSTNSLLVRVWRWLPTRELSWRKRACRMRGQRFMRFWARDRTPRSCNWGWIHTRGRQNSWFCCVVAGDWLGWALGIRAI